MCMPHGGHRVIGAYSSPITCSRGAEEDDSIAILYQVTDWSQHNSSYSTPQPESKKVLFPDQDTRQFRAFTIAYWHVAENVRPTRGHESTDIFFLNEEEIIIKLRTELLRASCPYGRITVSSATGRTAILARESSRSDREKKKQGRGNSNNTSVTRQETIAFTTPQAWGQTHPATQFHGSDP
jgi:hypothetical protein